MDKNDNERYLEALIDISERHLRALANIPVKGDLHAVEHAIQNFKHEFGLFLRDMQASHKKMDSMHDELQALRETSVTLNEVVTALKAFISKESFREKTFIVIQAIQILLISIIAYLKLPSG